MGDLTFDLEKNSILENILTEFSSLDKKYHQRIGQIASKDEKANIALVQHTDGVRIVLNLLNKNTLNDINIFILRQNCKDN